MTDTAEQSRRAPGPGCAGRSAAAWLAALVLALAGAATPAPASTDGALAPVSRGTARVSIAVTAAARASGLEDIVLAPWSAGRPAPSGRATACIYTRTGLYQLTATSAHARGDGFRLRGGEDFLSYEVRWDDGVRGPRPLRQGVALTGLVGDGDRPDCGGGMPATIEVGVALGGIRSAPVGRYADTVTVMIAPQ